MARPFRTKEWRGKRPWKRPVHGCEKSQGMPGKEQNIRPMRVACVHAEACMWITRATAITYWSRLQRAITMRAPLVADTAEGNTTKGAPLHQLRFVLECQVLSSFLAGSGTSCTLSQLYFVRGSRLSDKSRGIALSIFRLLGPCYGSGRCWDKGNTKCCVGESFSTMDILQGMGIGLSKFRKISVRS